ncbi:MAG: PAS domain S-box protein [Sulfitobacter sp.]|nr:PAS domain S-box protein [Sulfitobacter sp.]
MRKLEILLFVVCLAMTFALFGATYRAGEYKAQQGFDNSTKWVVVALRNRMDTYLQSLKATGAFMDASTDVTRADFDTYVSRLEIDNFLPGINGIGFIKPVVTGQEEEFLRETRALGESELIIEQEAQGPERFIVQRISPLGPNREALGLDIAQQEDRRVAAIRARETGEPQLTGRILLIQDDVSQPGFLLLYPLFGESTGDGQGPFEGWVYAPFTGADLLQNIFTSPAPPFQFSVYDGETTDPERLIYANDVEPREEARYRASYDLQLYGQTWHVEFASTPLFEVLFKAYLHWAILIIGLMVTLLLPLHMRHQRQRESAVAELAALRSRQVNAREEENRSIIENDVVSVLHIDENRRILFVNNAVEKTFGYRPSELKGMSFDALVTTPSDIDAEADFNAAGKTRDGRHLTLDLQCNSWRTDAGAERTTAILRDMTGHSQARNELRRTKAMYDLALRGSRIGVFDLDLRTGKSEVSDTGLEILGYDPADPIEDTQAAFMARVHPDDIKIIRQADQDCFDGKTVRSISEFRMSFPNDEWRWMRSDAVVIARDETGKPLRLIGTQTDVTELRQSRNALEASEGRFRQVVAAAPIGMALMSGYGQFLDANAAFAALSGYSREELLAGEHTLPDMMPPGELEEIYHVVTQMQEGDGGSTYRGEHRVIHRNGSERWGLINISWTFDKNAETNFFIVQINDITDQKELEQIKNEFVSTVSHELRTPLTSIKGALGLIQAADNRDLSPASKRLIDIARSNTDRLTTIVNDILDLEKISSGKVSFEFDDYDINALISEAVQELGPFAMTHKNSIALQLPEDPLPVRADHGRIKQVLANLLSNACKYSDDDSEIVVRAEELEGQAIIYVQNRGPGIPDAFRPRLFQAFSQADSSDTRAKGGTGLGLNITRQIILRHEGMVGFESIPDGITVFWFTLPLGSGCAAAQEERPPVVESDSRNGRVSVMHIEDDVDFAEVLSNGLKEVAEITHVSTVANARAQLSRERPEVIVVDWSLPDGDARDLIEEVFQSYPEVRVIGLSADADMHVDNRLYANLLKSRAELDTIASCVCGTMRRAS